MPSLSDYTSMRFAAGGHAVTRLLSQRIGAVLAWTAEKLGLSPSAVTLLGTAVFLGGALLYALAPAGAPAVIACLLLFQLGYGLDCADGQLARGTGRTSAFGAWLDVACDYVRTVVVGFALSLWLQRSGIAVEAAYALGAFYAAAASVQLHTATYLRKSAETAAITTRGAAQLLRSALTASLDTPTVLLVLALLRPFPLLLSLYVFGSAVLYLFMAGYLARKRIGR